MIIRKANPGDYGFVLECIKAFHDEAAGEYGVPFREDEALACMSEFVHSSFIAEIDGKQVGVIAGKDATYLPNGCKIYQEAFWYVVPGKRFIGPLLLEQLEKWCKENGYTAIVMAHLANHKAASFKAFYEMMGYTPLETHYLKLLHEVKK